MAGQAELGRVIMTIDRSNFPTGLSLSCTRLFCQQIYSLCDFIWNWRPLACTAGN